VRELIEHMLGVAGKDEARIREILLRGTLVAGASRFRWAGWEAGAEDLRALLATFPERIRGCPSIPRAVSAPSCGRPARHRDPARGGARKGLFRRATFWDMLMEIAVAEERFTPATPTASALTFTRATSAPAKWSASAPPAKLSAIQPFGNRLRLSDFGRRNSTQSARVQTDPTATPPATLPYPRPGFRTWSARAGRPGSRFRWARCAAWRRSTRPVPSGLRGPCGRFPRGK